jgi:hypothetical protein
LLNRTSGYASSAVAFLIDFLGFISAQLCSNVMHTVFVLLKVPSKLVSSHEMSLHCQSASYFAAK